jgi:all-trans-retinol dehydrogenase (NAD+)
MDQVLPKLKSLVDEFNKQYILTGKYKTNKFIFMTCLALFAFYNFIKNYGFLPKKSIKGEHVFLTGAGSGIGRLMAIELAKLGCNLSLSDIRMEFLEETKAEILKQTNVGPEVVNIFTCDVSNLDDITGGA